MSGFSVANALVVDDQGLVRAGMRSLLERATSRYAVHEACSCEEAIAKLAQTPFELAFLDLHLGGMESGLDILRFIHERELPCRAIMLSGDESRDTVLNCLALGAFGYITKASEDSLVFEKAIRSVRYGSVYLPASMLQRQAVPRGAAAHKPGGTPESLGLTARQSEVLYHLCQGLSNKAIARQMGIGEGTVRKSYVSELLRFFAVSRRTELMIEVSRRQLRLTVPGR
jgi:DNA-binding NarL/FixJ family response regulator